MNCSHLVSPPSRDVVSFDCVRMCEGCGQQVKDTASLGTGDDL